MIKAGLSIRLHLRMEVRTDFPPSPVPVAFRKRRLMSLELGERPIKNSPRITPRKLSNRRTGMMKRTNLTMTGTQTKRVAIMTLDGLKMTSTMALLGGRIRKKMPLEHGHQLMLKQTPLMVPEMTRIGLGKMSRRNKKIIQLGTMRLLRPKPRKSRKTTRQTITGKAEQTKYLALGTMRSHKQPIYGVTMQGLRTPVQI